MDDFNRIKFCANIIIEDNTFRGFDPNGTMRMYQSSSCLIQITIIMVDMSERYYNISHEHIYGVQL